jgi:hypothetical protein
MWPTRGNNPRELLNIPDASSQTSVPTSRVNPRPLAVPSRNHAAICYIIGIIIHLLGYPTILLTPPFFISPTLHSQRIVTLCATSKTAAAVAESSLTINVSVFPQQRRPKHHHPPRQPDEKKKPARKANEKSRLGLACNLPPIIAENTRTRTTSRCHNE